MKQNSDHWTQIFTLLANSNPHPRPELSYETPFELVVAVLLSAQATDKSVNRATGQLFPHANTPQKLLTCSPDWIYQRIRHIGLAKRKLQYLLGLSTLLINRFQGKIPQTRRELEALPGIGPKSANVILNTLFCQPVIAVDTHVFRVSKRLGLAEANRIDEVEKELMERIPKTFLLNSHHWLILHGRYVCKARRPRCHHCILRVHCPSRDQFDA